MREATPTKHPWYVSMEAERIYQVLTAQEYLLNSGDEWDYPSCTCTYDMPPIPEGECYCDAEERARPMIEAQQVLGLAPLVEAFHTLMEDVRTQRLLFDAVTAFEKGLDLTEVEQTTLDSVALCAAELWVVVGRDAPVFLPIVEHINDVQGHPGVRPMLLGDYRKGLAKQWFNPTKEGPLLCEFPFLKGTVYEKL